MSIVVLQSTVWAQGSSYLGYANAYLSSGAVVAASLEDVGYPSSNATSWLITGGGWRATTINDITLAVTLVAAQSLNSYAVYKHNLGDIGATIKLQHSSNGSAWTDLTGSEKVVANNKAIFFIGTPQTAKFWRIHISGLGASDTLIIGQAFIGSSLLMFSPPEPGFTPPELALNNDYITSRADGGDFLGRSLIRKGSKMSFVNSIVHRDWIRDNWQDVMVAIEKTPFYYAWDSTNYAAEVAYCYIDKKIQIPRYVNSAYFSLNLQFIALTE